MKLNNNPTTFGKSWILKFSRSKPKIKRNCTLEISAVLMRDTGGLYRVDRRFRNRIITNWSRRSNLITGLSFWI